MVLVSCPPRVKRGEDGKIKSAKGKLYPLLTKDAALRL